MTPNYVNNSSTEVSQWCSCDGSGNELQGCQRIMNMFSSNLCLRESNVIMLQHAVQYTCRIDKDKKPYNLLKMI